MGRSSGRPPVVLLPDTDSIIGGNDIDVDSAGDTATLNRRQPMQAPLTVQASGYDGLSVTADDDLGTAIVRLLSRANYGFVVRQGPDPIGRVLEYLHANHVRARFQDGYLRMTAVSGIPMVELGDQDDGSNSWIFLYDSDGVQTRIEIVRGPTPQMLFKRADGTTFLEINPENGGITFWGPDGSSGSSRFQLYPEEDGVEQDFSDEDGIPRTHLDEDKIQLLDASSVVIHEINQTAIGLFGATPVGQQATPVTLGDVIAILQAFGLAAT